MEDILTNESIVRLVNEDISLEDAKLLAYSQVFPCEYIPQTVQEGKTFICFDVDIQQSANKTFSKRVDLLCVLRRVRLGS